MLALAGLLVTSGGVFLFLWYRTVAGLPVARRPSFIEGLSFKWGIPGIALLLFTVGLSMLAVINVGLGSAAAGASLILLWLVIRFDRYSAVARIVYHRYTRLRDANPALEDLEVLFHTAKWRYPLWSQDRIVELVAGKDIGGLILLMLVTENKINPISDWELYRSIKRKVERITGKGESHYHAG
jgi:hypothetical protein